MQGRNSEEILKVWSPVIGVLSLDLFASFSCLVYRILFLFVGCFYFLKPLCFSIDSLFVWTGKWLAFLILHLISDRTTGGTNRYPDIVAKEASLACESKLYDVGRWPTVSLLKAVDTNGDGSIDFEERVKEMINRFARWYLCLQA